MGLAIVYLSGTGHHLFDQSAGLVADRIARSLKRSFEPETEFCYRVNLKPDAHQFPPDIPVDVASIEVAARREGTAHSMWVPVIDVLELKYLPRLTRTVSRLSAVGRAFWALRVIVRSQPLKSARTLVRSSVVSNPDDKLQLALLTVASPTLFASLFYWLILGITAFVGLAGEKLTGGIALWTTFLIVLGLVWSGFRHMIDTIEKNSMEYVSYLNYFNRLSDFKFIHDSLLDTISVAAQKSYEAIDILSIGFGGLIATNVIYPEHADNSSPALGIRNWITLGYPFDIMEATRPGFFKGRCALVSDKLSWINVVVQNDFLGTDFDQGSTRGIGIAGPGARVRIPDVNKCIGFAGTSQERWRSAALRQDYWIPFRRVTNQTFYWDNEDPRAPTCFDAMIELTGWKNSVRSVLEGRPTAAANSTFASQLK